MGRKIPGKKHKGVKDPNKQREKREAELETKINAPPKNIDHQDIPKSLQRVIKLKNDVKNGGIVLKKRKKKKGKKLITVGAQQSTKLPHPKAKPDKVVPIFSQKPGESNYHFLSRVNRETNAFIKETTFENKFNVDVKRNPKTGQIEGLSKRPKDELSELEKLRNKHKNIKKKKKKVTSENGGVKLSKSQKRAKKLLLKKQKKNTDDVDEFKVFKDNVEFGDIVHAPPELKILSKSADQRTRVKSDGLLLNSLLKNTASLTKENPKSIDRTGKRKDLPVGERRQLEKQQSDAIAAYRLMKTRKLEEST